VLDESLPFAETEQHYYEAELHRLRGELSLMQTVANREGAKRCFCRAIDIARRQSAKSWELRATTSLMRLLAKQATPRGAHDASLDLRLVHRRLRYPRSERRQGATGRGWAPSFAHRTAAVDQKPIDEILIAACNERALAVCSAKTLAAARTTHREGRSVPKVATRAVGPRGRDCFTP